MLGAVAILHLTSLEHEDFLQRLFNPSSCKINTETCWLTRRMCYFQSNRILLLLHFAHQVRALTEFIHLICLLKPRHGGHSPPTPYHISSDEIRKCFWCPRDVVLSTGRGLKLLGQGKPEHLFQA